VREATDHEVDEFIRAVIRLCKKYSGELSHKETERRHELRELVDASAGELDEDEN
jgi:hypothetical protein